MARIRTIKPEFFTSEDVVELPALARLLYIALWCEADREGRMEWKPRSFKLKYLAADDCDIFSLCDYIIKRGLVVLYGDGLAYIPAFSKHQHINNREQASRLPAPTEADASITRQSRVNHACPTEADGAQGEGKGREGKVVNPLMSGKPDPVPPSIQKLNGHTHEARELLDFLNAKAGRGYKPVASTLRPIV